MIPKFEPETAIYEARRRLGKVFGWRKLRNLSIAIAFILKSGIDKERARELAKDITGVPPEPWLSAGEAVAEMERLGVRFAQRRLQRLVRKAVKAQEGQFCCWMNAKGHWDGEGSRTLENPVVALVVEVRGSVARFRIIPLSQDLPNCDTRRLPF